MRFDDDQAGPGGYAYGWRWGSDDARVVDEIRECAQLLDIPISDVIHRVLEALDLPSEVVDDGTHLHRLHRYRVLRRGDEVLSVRLGR